MLFLPCFQCYFYHIFNTIFTIFSMHILPRKNVLLKITLEDFKNHFWILKMLNINLMVSPYRWRCMYNSPYWRSIFKIPFFQIFKKIFDLCIFFFHFFFHFFFQKNIFLHFQNLQNRSLKWFLGKKSFCQQWD